MTAPTTVPSRRRGWWYPYIYVAGFLVVLAVNLVMMRSAIVTFSGVETEQAYQKGIEYNRVLDAAAAQKKLGWTVTADIHADGATAVVIDVSFRDRDDRPIDGLTVDAGFIRPTASGHDSHQALAAVGNGRYQAAVSLPLAGQWDLRLEARRGEQTYQLSKRIRVP
jgi:nitrogen fixation protein FixH